MNTAQLEDQPVSERPAHVPSPDPPPATAPARRPVYVRLLRLQHLRPSSWQRAVLAEGSLFLPVVLVLADLASAWLILVFPLAVAGMVKAHDLLTGVLEEATGSRAADPDGAR